MSANVETSGFVGRVLGGRWVVGTQLGSGSFGVVHAGIERGTGLAVAVKLLHPQFLHHHETIARFWNEAEALRRMNHPNVLVLLDVGVADDGVPYLVTELLTGETLRDLLNREGALPPERAMRLLGPAAHALHHAHLAGIVHRDLKPENIFRVRRDGMGTTKILDFGLAKLLDTQPGKKLSQTGIMIGTMAYSPPEQMQGVGDIDHRADQFGFAALMFEALTGQRPFPHTQPFALFQAVMNGARPRASSIRPGLPRALDDVLIRGLDADRNRRFANVEEFYLALTQSLTAQAPAGISTTFNGSPPVPAAPIPRTPPQVASQPHAAPPASSKSLISEPSSRFRAIDEEPTRGLDVPVASLSSTLHSGGRITARTPQTTLMEGEGAPPAAPLVAAASESQISTDRKYQPPHPSGPPPQFVAPPPAPQITPISAPIVASSPVASPVVSSGAQPVDAKVASEAPAAAPTSGRTVLLALLAFVAAAIVFALYWFLVRKH